LKSDLLGLWHLSTRGISQCFSSLSCKAHMSCLKHMHVSNTCHISNTCHVSTLSISVTQNVCRGWCGYGGHREETFTSAVPEYDVNDSMRKGVIRECVSSKTPGVIRECVSSKTPGVIRECVSSKTPGVINHLRVSQVNDL